VEVSEKKTVLDTEKRGIITHYCAIPIPPSQPPFIAYNIAQYIFPTTPFIAIKIKNKILAISCKGQPTDTPFVCHTPYTIGDGNIV